MTTNIELHHEDCLSGMQKLPDASVDVVVTSPPYNIGIQYSTYDDTKNRNDYLEWCLSWAQQIKRVLKDKGSFFLNIGASPTNPMLPHELALKFASLFVLQNTIHWVKSITVKPKNGSEISVGHYKPIQSKRFLNDCHEYIFHFSHSGNTPVDRLAVGVEYSDKSNINRWDHTEGQDLRCRGNTWFIPYKTIRNRSSQRPHPATFPVELVTQCLKLHGIHRDLTLLDPFLGIGSSALAARECGIAGFIGFEIDEEYMEEARKRLTLEASPA